ncbi:MAG: peptide-methionine (S)-S-oxide reductase MsrA [Alphaproteobacteria bacterium]|nr:peptide-methionine (S)-S-oxide reductase MsrA [Alphaproteobacteria bacterium]
MIIGTLRNALAVLALSLAVAAAALAAQENVAPAVPKGADIAIFAGGCFWCVEADFDGVPGVLGTVSGYTGGALKNPTYETVTAGGSGHREAVRIVFDPKLVSYAKLVEVFWRSVDPTDDGGQFCDRGESYKTAIFAKSPEHKRIAEASKERLQKSGVLKRPVVTPIEAAGAFYPAEGYHQDYYKKNPIRYNLYRYGCGRNARLKELWGRQALSGIKKD